MAQELRILTEAERNAELAARNGADSGNGTRNDALLVTGNGLRNEEWGGDTFDTIYEAWNKANPGRMSKPQFREWYLDNNTRVIINVRDCRGNPDTAPNVPRGVTIKLPEGNEITQLDWAWACPKPTPPLPPAPPAPPEPPMPPAPPPPPRPETQVDRMDLQERLRRATPAQMGLAVTPETSFWAYETRAQSGVDPKFTKQWYKLEDVAARIPVLFARDSGQYSDFFHIEGDRFFGESRASRRDDSRRDKDSQESGRQRAFVAGYMEFTIETRNGQQVVVNNANGKTLPLTEVFGPNAAQMELPNGTKIRYNREIFETAHGGDYPLQASRGTGVLIDIPVGAVTTKPSSQMPFDARTIPAGITLSHAVLSIEDFVGRDTLTRDTQAQTSDPFESADRVNALTRLQSSRRDLAESLQGVESATNPADRDKAALKALTAFRDFSDNNLIVRVDALRQPLSQDRAAIEAYLASKGVDVAAIRTQAAAADRLPIRFMDRETYLSLQDIDDHGGIDPATGLSRNPQYMGIRPGEPIPGAEASDRQVFTRQGQVEYRVAGGYARDLTQEQMEVESDKAWDTITRSDDAIRAIGRGMAADDGRYELALEFGEGLADMTRNPKNYGFRNKEEAEAFVKQFTKPSEAAQRQLTNNGNTMWMMDDPHNMNNPRLFGQVAGTVIQENPELFREAMDRMTSRDGEYLDRRGRTDGRRYGIATLRALGREGGTDANAWGPTYLAVQAAIGKGSPEELQAQQAMIDAAAHAERAAAGRSVVGFNWLDAQLVAAQTADRVRNGEKVEMVTDATVDAREAALRASGQGGRVQLINTGRIDTSAAYAAAASGDRQALFNAIATSAAAQANNGDEIVTKILAANPTLARDATTIALLQHPEAFDGAIKWLRDQQRSVQRSGLTQGQRYGDLADHLSSAQNWAEKYQRTGNPADLREATRIFGDFFKDMEVNANGNGGAWRENAWKAFMNAAGEDDKASAAILAAIGSDPQMRDATLASLANGLQYVDGVRVTNAGKVGEGNQLAGNMRGDDNYRPRFFTVPEHLRRGPAVWFQNVEVHDDEIASVVGAGGRGGRGTGRGDVAAGTPAGAAGSAAAGATGGADRPAGATGTPAGAAGTPAGAGDLPAGLTSAALPAGAALTNAGVTSGVSAGSTTLNSGEVRAGDLSALNVGAVVPGANSGDVAAGVATAVTVVDKRLLLLLLGGGGGDNPGTIPGLPPGCCPEPYPGSGPGIG